MDAFFFSMKRAHLGWERLGRRFLKGFELTPARFDLLNTLADYERGDEYEPMKQAELWKRLGVVRSAVCEMVKVLVKLGVLERERVPGERTWFVKLTALGRRLQKAAFDVLVNDGIATQWADHMMTAGKEVNPMEVRHHWSCVFRWIGAELGNWVRRNSDLYTWDIEELYGCVLPLEALADGTETESWGEVPLMDERWIAENSVE